MLQNNDSIISQNKQLLEMYNMITGSYHPENNIF